MKRVLFVDDEQNVLDGLKRMLYPMRNEWRMAFVSSGRDALKLLSESEYDLLITDLRMPEMSGIDLLSEVVNRYPQVVRMVLSGTADQEITLRSTALAHQYLVKPCDAATLRSTVERAFNLRVMLDDPDLKQLISRLHSLPSVPAQYARLMELLGSADTSPKQIGEVISQDISMTAKILQLANSAFFGLRRQITAPWEAVVYLGLETVRDLAAVASVFSAFRPQKMRHFSIDTLQTHSLAVGALARRIAESLQLSKQDTDNAYVGGLLHDVGKLVLAANYPEKYEAAMARAQDEAIPVRQAEREAFGSSHTEVGGYLLWLWALPDAVTETVFRHHEISLDSRDQISPAAVVNIADSLVSGDPDEAIAIDDLARMGWQHHVDGWKRMSAQYRCAA